MQPRGRPARGLAGRGRLLALSGDVSDAVAPAGGWRASQDAVRLRLAPGRVAPSDEGGFDLAQDPCLEMGDPVLRRRDGAIAYHLAVVVDDAAQAVTRVVRGGDLAASTALQVVLQRALGLPTPSYRHHLLLLEPRGEKLAKLHGAVGWRALRALLRRGPHGLAGSAGRPARDATGPVTRAGCSPDFAWERFAARPRGEMDRKALEGRAAGRAPVW